jgi:tetratricopeptide (TPR) repeat protein
MNRHLEGWELQAYLASDQDAVDLAALRSHLQHCAVCRDELQSQKTFTDWLATQFSLHDHPRSSSLRELQELANRRRTEEEHARAALAAWRELPSMWRGSLRSHPFHRTGGMVRVLTNEARQLLNREPALALEYLLAAQPIAASLSDNTEAATGSGEVAKELANAYRLLGRLPEALAAVDAAAAAFRRLPAAAFELALVDWSRATVLFAMTRYAEALRFVHRAANVLREFGDTERVAQVQVLEAGILYEQGDVDAARRRYLSLLPLFIANADDETLARVHANLAECSMALARADEAQEHAAAAIAIYQQRSEPIEVLRVEWTLGYLLLQQGRLSEAEPLLASCVVGFEGFGMTTDAAGVQLDLVELHISRGSWKLAGELAARCAACFTSAAVPVNLARACDYLRNTVHARSDTVDQVRALRSVLHLHARHPGSGTAPADA